MLRRWSEDEVECDICENDIVDFFVDGKTKDGSWAKMCGRCFLYYGVGTGIGKGQAYVRHLCEEDGKEHFVRQDDLLRKPVEQPDEDQLAQWMEDGMCEATDGCIVELDGQCEHGCPSWFIELGLL